MTEMIVDNIISKVPKGGILWNLGDVSFGRSEETAQMLKRIADHCEHHLIFGNHDHGIEKHSQYFKSMQHDTQIKVGKRTFILHHFEKKIWDRAHHGTYHLFGHAHSQYQPDMTRRCMDVGIDTRAGGDMKPYSFDEICAILDPIEPIKHHNL